MPRLPWALGFWALCDQRGEPPIETGDAVIFYHKMEASNNQEPESRPPKGEALTMKTPTKGPPICRNSKILRGSSHCIALCICIHTYIHPYLHTYTHTYGERERERYSRGLLRSAGGRSGSSGGACKSAKPTQSTPQGYPAKPR